MKTASSQTRWLAQESTRRVLRRVSSTVAVLAVLAAAIGVPVMSPESDSGTNPVLAIARADCPPDCGGGPGNGGMPSGPPGGGTEFVPPSIPAMPSYDPGRGQPPLDQNNGISIYNSAAPQPGQAAQPSQAPVQNQDGSYSRAANGEQQPINHNAPNNQQINQDWQQLSNQLNNQTGQPAQNDGQPDQSQSQDNGNTCESVLAPLGVGAVSFTPSDRSTSKFSVGLSQQAIDALVAAGLPPQRCGVWTSNASPRNSGPTNADALSDFLSTDNPDGLPNSFIAGCVTGGVTGGITGLIAGPPGAAALGAAGCVGGGAGSMLLWIGVKALS